MGPWAGELGRRLRAAREATGWTPAQAAELTHGPVTVSGELIGKWERAERNIRVPQLYCLAELYRVPVAELLPRADGGGAPFPERTADPDAPVVLDVTALWKLPPHIGRTITHFVTTVLTDRGHLDADQVRIRATDVYVLAASHGTTPAGLLDQLARWGVLMLDT